MKISCLLSCWIFSKYSDCERSSFRCGSASKLSSCSRRCCTLSTLVLCALTTTNQSIYTWTYHYKKSVVHPNETLPFSPSNRKLVTIDSFSDVVYFCKIPLFLLAQESVLWRFWSLFSLGSFLVNELSTASCWKLVQSPRNTVIHHLPFLRQFSIKGPVPHA